MTINDLRSVDQKREGINHSNAGFEVQKGFAYPEVEKGWKEQKFEDEVWLKEKVL